jgi:rRNA-processing protein FCF1
MELLNKVAVDTNMLMAITQFNLPITTLIKEKIGKTEFYITPQIKKELNGLKKNYKKEINIAIQVIEKEKFKETKINAKNADESLIKLSKKGYLIATNDKELKEKIKKENGKIIFLRQKKLIEII